MTVTGAIRYDWFKTSFPAQTVGPGPAIVGLQNRNISFPAQDDLNWKDITYRMGFVYDPRGNGQSAIKVAMNKYLLGQTLNGFGSSPNPVNALATNAFRPWTDNNRDFVVNCDLSNRVAQSPATTASIDTCGPVNNNAFGSTTPLATFDPLLLTGWGHRPSNWEFSASVQQQLPKRMSVDIGYYRRIWQNFPVVDNTLVAANEFQAFTMTVPTDSRFPNGGGNQLTYYNVIPTKVGQTQNFNTLSDKYGEEYEHWNGVDVSVAGRMQNGLRFQAGTSTGVYRRRQLRHHRAGAGDADERPGQRRRHCGGRPTAREGILSPRGTVADQLQGAHCLHRAEGRRSAGVHLPQRARPHEHERRRRRRRTAVGPGRELRGDQRVSRERTRTWAGC